MSLSSRVAKGVALLDGHDSQWVGKVNLETLNLASGYDCVLGQVFGDYATGKEVFGLDMDESHDHGFTETGDGSWGDLTDEWVRVIGVRQTRLPVSALSDSEAVALVKSAASDASAFADLVLRLTGRPQTDHALIASLR